MDGVVFLSCWLFGMGHPTLELASHWVELGLSVEMEISGRALPDWYYMGPGGPSWSSVLDWLSQLVVSGPTPGRSTKTLPATQLGRKGRKKRKEKKEKNRYNSKPNGESKTKETKSHKETCTHTDKKKTNRKLNRENHRMNGKNKPKQTKITQRNIYIHTHKKRKKEKKILI